MHPAKGVPPKKITLTSGTQNRNTDTIMNLVWCPKNKIKNAGTRLAAITGTHHKQNTKNALDPGGWVGPGSGGGRLWMV